VGGGEASAANNDNLSFLHAGSRVLIPMPASPFRHPSLPLQSHVTPRFLISIINANDRID
jgi:hypothetical protein